MSALTGSRHQFAGKTVVMGQTETSHDVRVTAALLLNADVAFLRAVLQATSE